MKFSVYHTYQLLLSLLFFSALSFAFYAFPTFAQAGSIYVSPASGTYAQGSTFSLTVGENSGGDAVNAVQVNLSYPADKLDFLGVSGNGSSFSIDASSGGGGGSISISRGSIGGGITGGRTIAVVSFRAKSSGAATVNVTGGSLVRASDQANVYSGGSGGTYTLGPGTNQPTSTTKTPSTQQPLQKKNNRTTNSSPTPIISSISVTNLSHNTATISWTTDVLTDSQITYGLSSHYGFDKSDKTLTKNHSLSLDSNLLSAGGAYHYQVLGTTSQGISTTSEDQIVTIPGYEVHIIVTGSNKQIIKGADVTIGTQPDPRKSVTDSNGIAVFKDMPNGKFTVVAQYQNKTQATTLTVINDTQPQELTLSMTTTGTQFPYILLIASVVLVIFCILIIYLVFNHKKNTPPPPPPPASQVTTPLSQPQTASQSFTYVNN